MTAHRMARPGGATFRPTTPAGRMGRNQLDILEDLARRQNAGPGDGFVLAHTIARRYGRTTEAMHRTAASLVRRGLIELGARDGWITYRITDAGRQVIA